MASWREVSNITLCAMLLLVLALVHSGDSLKVGALNVNGLRNNPSRKNFDMVEKYLTSHRYDIFVVGESRIVSYKAKITIPKYGYVRVDRQKPHTGGGVVIYIRDYIYEKIPKKLIEIVTTPDLIQYIHIPTNLNWDIVGIYLPPVNSGRRFTFDNQKDELERILMDVKSKRNHGNDIIVLGDVNLNIKERKIEVAVKAIESATHFTQLIDKDSCTFSKGSCLDHVYVTRNDVDVKCGVQKNYIQRKYGYYNKYHKKPDGYKLFHEIIYCYLKTRTQGASVNQGKEGP